jgi:hypothetical protein
MKSRIKARVVLMALLSLLVFGSAIATGSATQPGKCQAACNEAFRSRMATCRTLPKGERKVCEARAKEAHQNCLHRCN